MERLRRRLRRSIPLGVADRAADHRRIRVRTLPIVDLTPEEIRVLGCLVEKQKLTPDAYPLSLNALRLATNQSTSRDPVVDYDDDTLRDALARLYRRRWARLASTSGRSSRRVPPPAR